MPTPEGRKKHWDLSVVQRWGYPCDYCATLKQNPGSLWKLRTYKPNFRQHDIEHVPPRVFNRVLNHSFALAWGYGGRLVVHVNGAHLAEMFRRRKLNCRDRFLPQNQPLNVDFRVKDPMLETQVQKRLVQCFKCKSAALAKKSKLRGKMTQKGTCSTELP